ncbi:MAG: tRNA (N6-isopentenyl adenosine(37)-C2)-methylthiotransferase MiaB [Patescibacteria group bacterium]|nr:tRNA (N6-isopentenyl adenosine(37)-C2)-methylthiotransferase MiaB [Patescibacteria group bacterium]
MKTYSIITIGCQMNKSDSERVAACFEDLGFKEAAKRSQADFVALATCGVRQSAENRVYGLIPKIKKENSNAKIILTGCLSEREDVIKRLKENIDIWLPINQIINFKEILADSESKNLKIEPCDYLKIKPKYTSAFSAFVPIGNGCDNFCTYCVVPYARGHEVYRDAEEILNEVKDLAGRGYKEIILIAQNVNSYKSRIKNQESGIKNQEVLEYNYVNFSRLLRLANNISGDFWIRFATSHPKDMSDDLILAISECKKVCRHIHLPAQSGDNDILKAMNRKYKIEHYLELIKKIKNNIKSELPIAITTDIIIGFPGETEKQFKKTVELFKEVKYDMAYIARYSPRPGTDAEKMEDDVEVEEKKDREKKLMKILRKTALKNNQKYLGKIVKVLAEGQNKKGILFGKTETNKTVKFLGDKKYIGKFVKVKIEKVENFGLRGVLGK